MEAFLSLTVVVGMHTSNEDETFVPRHSNAKEIALLFPTIENFVCPGEN
jgi:hypothetical protein